MLITTPETIQNLLMSKSIRRSLGNLRVVIVDELHELYYNKRGAQLSIALERLEELSRGYQRIGISATIGDINEASRFLFNERKHRLISSSLKKRTEITVEMPIRPEHDDKEFRLSFGLDVQAYARIIRVSELINGSRAAIVFANTRQAVESLGSKLIHLEKTSNFGKVGIHHSSIDKEERITIENDFKSGAIKAIIATSSLELGIDIGAVDLVVQYGSPRQVTRLIQRVGRGGHREISVSVGRVIVHNELDCLESVAIAEAALDLKLEKHRVEKNALDVLANQIAAIAMEYGKIGSGQALEMIRRSYVYNELKLEDFERTCDLLADLRIIKYDKESISYGARGRSYFINAISVIPDSSRFVVKEAMENRMISTLDEEFVYNYIDQGSVFITKGLPWKVISVEEGTIFVEPSDDITAAVPDWDGEDIPVARQIAVKVWEYMRSGIKLEKAKIEPKTHSSITRFIDENRRYFMPDEKSITIEELDNSAIAYMPTGKLANEFIARTVSIIASSYAGGRVNTRATPYAIILDYSDTVRRPDTAKVFQALRNINLQDRNLVFDSELYRYKFIQAAKLFGVAEKRAAITKSMANRLMSFYENSPISDETSRDLYKNYFDIEVTQGLMEGIRSGEIKIELARKTPSPLSKAILQSVFKYGELLSTPERETVIDKMFDKFDGRSVKMMCTFCSHVFNEKIKVNDSGKILCTNCKSPLIVIYGARYEDLIRKRLSHGAFRESDNRLYRDMMKEASLVDAYGYRAIVALSVYGIGIETAARVLKYIRSDYKMFFVDVIGAQRNFIKNRRFWKID
jgi:ATP-dependent Lhr-like helicase